MVLPCASPSKCLSPSVTGHEPSGREKAEMLTRRPKGGVLRRPKGGVVLTCQRSEPWGV